MGRLVSPPMTAHAPPPPPPGAARPELGELVRQLAAALADELAEPVARRVVDLLRDGDAIDLVDQHTSPLGPRRHVKLCRKGVLPHTRLGRRWCVRRSDLEAYLGTGAEAPPRPANDTAPRQADEALAAELGLRVVKPLSIAQQAGDNENNEQSRRTKR